MNTYSNNTKCPKCGCSEIGEGVLEGYAAMRPKGRVFASSSIIADVCSNCGYIIEMRVAKPEKFRKKN